jgi:flotillin
MAKAIAEPFGSIDNISIIDSGNGEGGVNSMGTYVPGALAKTLQAVKEVTGLDLVEVMKAETYDAKVNRNINISGIEGPVDAETIAEAIKKSDEPDLPFDSI